MILKVFTKRTKGGEYISTGLEWKEGMYESSSIKKKETGVGFNFYLTGKNDKRDRVILVTTSLSGYEILNDQGVSIERYVTPIKYPIATESGETIYLAKDGKKVIHEAKQERIEGGIKQESKIISDKLIGKLIENCKQCKLKPPYILVVSTHRAMAPEWMDHITDTFKDIKDIERVSNLPVDTVLLRKDTQHIEHEKAKDFWKESDEEILNKCS